MASFIELSFILLFYLIRLSSNGELQTCTLNNNYGYLRKVLRPIEICQQDQTCTAYLKNGTRYTGCRVGDDPINNYFQVYILKRSIDMVNATKQCKTAGTATDVWNVACDYMNNFIFTPKKGIELYETYILECGQRPATSPIMSIEIPDIDRIRFQIYNYDFAENINSVFEIPPITTVRCESQCLETQHLASLIPKPVNRNLDCRQNKCGVSMTDPNSKTGNFECGPTGQMFIQVKYYLLLTFDVTLTKVNETLKRVSNKFDALEWIKCNVLPKRDSTANLIKCTPPSGFINLYPAGDSMNILNKNDMHKAQIPSPVPSDLKYMCFFGNRTRAEHAAEFHNLLEGAVPVAADKCTYLTSKTGSNTAITDFPDLSVYEFPVGVNIQCNASAYNITEALISIYELKTFEFPLSEYILKAGTKVVDKAKEYLVKKKTTNQSIEFVFCTYNNKLSTPVPIYTARPYVRWKYLHPPWATKYHLRKYIQICESSQTRELTAACVDCPPNASPIETQKKKENFIIFTVKATATLQSKVTYSCVGQSVLYPDIVITQTYQIIVRSNIDLDYSKKIFQVHVDYVGCKAQFSLFDGSVKTGHILMMTYLYAEGQLYKSTPDEKQIQIPNPFDQRKDVVEYSYCCPTFDENANQILSSQYRCLSKKKLFVTKTYTTRFNLPEDEIYPGNLVRCFICVQYTIDKKPPPCNNLRKIPTYISMYLKYPNNTYIEINNVDFVQMPKNEIKTGSTYYDVDEYYIELGCFVRKNYPIKMRRIYLRSCNTKPPPIFIRPKHKSMFKVGDIFSCDTDSVDCKESLKYVTSISYRTTLLTQNFTRSLELTKEHVGNQIFIRCRAGTAEGRYTTDVRKIRVEMEPYNITISNLKPIMRVMEYLRCEAQGFPVPEIIWNQPKGPSRLRISEFLVLIGPWDFSGNYSIECRARNKRGDLLKTADFLVFNHRMPPIIELSLEYYVVMTILGLFYIIMSGLSLILIFQENVFGYPLFSDGGAKDAYYKSKKTDREVANERKASYNVISQKSIFDENKKSSRSSQKQKDSNITDKKEETL